MTDQSPVEPPEGIGARKTPEKPSTARTDTVIAISGPYTEDAIAAARVEAIVRGPW
jgi:hypothetical protein